MRSQDVAAMTGHGAAKRGEVIRYDLERCDGESGRCRAEVGPAIGGDWVLYADHVTHLDAAVAEACRIQLLEDLQAAVITRDQAVAEVKENHHCACCARGAK